MDPVPRKKIAIVIPTFNEQDELQKAVDSLVSQPEHDLTLIVVNAGDALRESIAKLVEEIDVPSNVFWTGCVKVGFDRAREGDYDYVMLANSDTELGQGAIAQLVEVAETDPKIIAACAAYIRQEDDSIRLLYSDDIMVPFMLHNFTKRRWTTLEEAPSEPYETGSIGGQGVLFRREVLDRFDVDPVRFPHAKGDIDFWLTLKRHGYRIIVVPHATVINNRGFGATAGLSRKQKLKKIKSLALSQYSRDSLPTLWRLRRKHLGPIGGPLSFLISVPAIWSWRVYKLIRYSR